MKVLRLCQTVLTYLRPCNYRYLHSSKISPPPEGGGRNFLWGRLKSTVYESNPRTIQELKDISSHAAVAIKITTLHRVYPNMVRPAQLCIDAGGNHFQHLLWRYILSAFGYRINFCIYAMLRTRATFSWPTLYNNNNNIINWNWIVTRWQWLFYMYTEYEIGY